MAQPRGYQRRISGSLSPKFGPGEPQEQGTGARGECNCRQIQSPCWLPALSWEPPAVEAAGREAVPSTPAGTGECE